MKRTRIGKHPIDEPKRRRRIELTEEDIARQTPGETAFQRAVRRCTGALEVRVDASRVYLGTSSGNYLRYYRPVPRKMTQPGTFWLVPVPARRKPKKSAQAPQVEAPAPQPEPSNVVQLRPDGMRPDGMPGAKQTSMVLPERTFRDVALEIIRRHQPALWNDKERGFVDQLIDRREPMTARQAKWLRDICRRLGVQPWNDPAASA